MHNTIAAVAPGSAASKTIIACGDTLRRINGHAIGDILDYQYYSYDRCLLLELTEGSGIIKLVRISKPEGADPGLEFKSPLLDRQRSCGNKCIFCFIDQLPKGMRETLYYKDDDVRLSFLQGNYVTLTNLSREDIGRIIKMRISPINVSVHTLNPKLRRFMLGNTGRGLRDNHYRYIKALTRAGIELNCQIVCCPGINDGHELRKTMEGLEKLGPGIHSVSIVPVGLTKYRDGLFKLSLFDRKTAERTVRQVEAFGNECLKKRGSRVFYCADELYMTAGRRLPPGRFYEDYPQLENGVGMMRLFITEFAEAMKNREPVSRKPATVSVATGTLAAPYLTKLLQAFTAKYDTIKCRIHPVGNRFFGESVTVSGLVTGGDIIKQLKGIETGSKLLIPANMLRSGGDVFLDDVTTGELSTALGVQVEVVTVNGKALFEALIRGEECPNLL